MTMDEFTDFKIVEQSKLEALEACFKALHELRATVDETAYDADDAIEWVLQKLGE